MAVTVMVDRHCERTLIDDDGQWGNPQATFARHRLGVERAPVVVEKSAEAVLAHASSLSRRL
jgi:hypothetical protein